MAQDAKYADTHVPSNQFQSTMLIPKCMQRRFTRIMQGKMAFKRQKLYFSLGFLHVLMEAMPMDLINVLNRIFPHMLHGIY